MLCKDASKRLSLDEVLEHSWFTISIEPKDKKSKNKVKKQDSKMSLMTSASSK